MKQSCEVAYQNGYNHGFQDGTKGNDKFTMCITDDIDAAYYNGYITGYEKAAGDKF